MTSPGRSTGSESKTVRLTGNVADNSSGRITPYPHPHIIGAYSSCFPMYPLPTVSLQDVSIRTVHDRSSKVFPGYVIVYITLAVDLSPAHQGIAKGPSSGYVAVSSYKATYDSPTSDSEDLLPRASGSSDESQNVVISLHADYGDQHVSVKQGPRYSLPFFQGLVFGTIKRAQTVTPFSDDSSHLDVSRVSATRV